MCKYNWNEQNLNIKILNLLFIITAKLMVAYETFIHMNFWKLDAISSAYYW